GRAVTGSCRRESFQPHRPGIPGHPWPPYATRDYFRHSHRCQKERGLPAVAFHATLCRVRVMHPSPFGATHETAISLLPKLQGVPRLATKKGRTLTPRCPRTKLAA